MKTVTIEVIRLPRVTVAVLSLILAVSCAAWADGARALAGAPPALGPFGMAGKSVGGAYAIGSAKLMNFVGYEEDPRTHAISYDWKPVCGAPNVGLTAKIWGKVTAAYHLPTGERWFYVDDGSDVDSDLGDVGVLVYSDANVTDGQFVSVVGTVSVDQSFDSWYRLVRTIETSSAADVQVLKEAPVPEHPFSDEFDSPTLKPGWKVFPGQGNVSLTQEPGWLALTAESTTDGGGISPFVVQIAQDDWALDAKVRCPAPADSYSEIDIVLSSVPDTLDSEVGFWRALGEAGVYAGKWMHGSTLYHGPDMGDTCYLRVRQSGGTYFASYSFDGSAYSAETPFTGGIGYVSLCYHFLGQGPAASYTGYVDYIRRSASQ